MFGIRLNWLVLGALLATACGGVEGDEVDDPGIAAQADALTHKYHYTPSVQAVRWDPGCGIVGPTPSNPCDFGLVVTYTKSYADLKTTVTHSVNHRTHTVTLKLDTWSTGTIHSMIAVRPQDLNVGALGLQAGQAWTVVVKDYQGSVLFTGHVTSEFHL